jgi:hypothetical protein
MTSLFFICERSLTKTTLFPGLSVSELPCSSLPLPLAPHSERTFPRLPIWLLYFNCERSFQFDFCASLTLSNYSFFHLRLCISRAVLQDCHFIFYFFERSLRLDFHASLSLSHCAFLSPIPPASQSKRTFWKTYRMVSKLFLFVSAFFFNSISMLLYRSVTGSSFFHLRLRIPRGV